MDSIDDIKKLCTISNQIKYISCTRASQWQECQRSWYYRTILNLEDSGIAVALHTGSAAHAGFDGLFANKSIVPAKKSINAYCNELAKRPYADEAKVSQIRTVAIAVVSGWAHRNAELLKEMVVSQSEIYFQMDIRKWCSIKGFRFPSDFVFAGTADLVFEYKGLLYVGDHKTKGQVDDNIIAALSFDRQVNLYPFGVCPSKDVEGFYYNIIKRPAIRQKQTETAEQFEARLEQEYKECPDKYFFPQWIKRNKPRATSVFVDLARIAEDIMWRRATWSDGQWINPASWARNPKQCTTYGRCRYFDLCKVGINKSTLMGYRTTDARYLDAQERKA